MKNKTFFTWMLALTFLAAISPSFFSCSGQKEYEAHGTIQSKEDGKDGYTVTIRDEDGNDFDAVFSKVTLGDQYRVFTVGERLKVTGDTIHMNNRVRVMVKKIN